MKNREIYIADVKVGKVKGHSRVYPQLRLPSQYAELVGKKASIYETSEPEGDIAFIIRFDNEKQFADRHGNIQPQNNCLTNGHQIEEYCLNKPCRGFTNFL
jgi:hypothetical protein